MSTKQNIRSVCGLFKSKTSVTKALLKERARDKKRKEAKLKKLASRQTCEVLARKKALDHFPARLF